MFGIWTKGALSRSRVGLSLVLDVNDMCPLELWLYGMGSAMAKVFTKNTSIIYDSCVPIATLFIMDMFY